MQQMLSPMEEGLIVLKPEIPNSVRIGHIKHLPAGTGLFHTGAATVWLLIWVLWKYRTATLQTAKKLHVLPIYTKTKK